MGARTTSGGEEMTLEEALIENERLLNALKQAIEFACLELHPNGCITSVEYSKNLGVEITYTDLLAYLKEEKK
jgi:hypothetical protein